MKKQTMKFKSFISLKLIWVVALLLTEVSPSRAQSSSSPLNLVWDNGATDIGTTAVSAPSTAAGNYYYRINTRSVEAWRSRLTVTSGEAHLHLFRGAIPVPALFSGISFSQPSTTLGSKTSVISVRIKPGATTFVLMFLEPSSLATDFEKPIIPAFDAA